MSYYGTYFDKHLAHRAKYGTANSTSSEKGTDNKKNNTFEYNHKYYEKNKNKWARESKYNPNGDDDDFKKVYGDDLKNPKLNMDTHIKGTDFYQTTNKNGQVVLINGDKKWALPKGVKLTDELKQALSSIDSHQGKHDNEFLGKMAKFLDEAAKKQPGQGHGSSKKSSEKTEETKKSSGTTRSFDEVKKEYNEEKNKKAKDAASAAQEKGKKRTEEEKKKKKNTSLNNKPKITTVKHSDIGSILVRDIF